jgi:hypothetical protein
LQNLRRIIVVVIDVVKDGCPTVYDQRELGIVFVTFGSLQLYSYIMSLYITCVIDVNITKLRVYYPARDSMI